MYVIDDKKICVEKMKLLHQGYTAYVESPTLTKRLAKEIHNENLLVYVEYTQGGCYFTPINSALGS